MKNIFDPSTTSFLFERIEKLTPTTNPQWGKMNVSQMFAHCSKPYDGIYGDSPKVKGVKRILLRLFLKNMLTSEKPYSKNVRTAPEFIVADNRDFEKEKAKLKNYIEQTQKLGANHFEGFESISFGALTANEWSNLLYKHLDHHLSQFGV